jgi:hypothetical protein
MEVRTPSFVSGYGALCALPHLQRSSLACPPELRGGACQRQPFNPVLGCGAQLWGLCATAQTTRSDRASLARMTPLLRRATAMTDCGSQQGKVGARRPVYRELAMHTHVLALREVDSALHAAILVAADGQGSRPVEGFSTKPSPPKSPCSLGPVRRARWQLAIASELAQSGFMELAPVRDSKQQVTDFEWISATPMASRLMTGLGNELTGRRLLDVMANHADARTVFDAYRNVAARCMASAVVVQRSGAGMDSAVVHRVNASAESVAVVLSSPSAMSREAACKHALRALEAESVRQRGNERSIGVPGALVASDLPRD